MNHTLKFYVKVLSVCKIIYKYKSFYIFKSQVLHCNQHRLDFESDA